MRTLTPTILFLFSISALFGQPEPPKNRFMSFTQNQAWLKATKALDKARRWKEIKERFFFTDNRNIVHDSIQYSPLVVINGIPLSIPDSLTKKDEMEILGVLNLRAIKRIEIVDRQPDAWIFHKPFSGIVVLSVDKTTNKKLAKLK